MSLPDEFARFADVPIDLEAHLDRRMMSAGELLSLRRGDLIPLSRSAGDNADILAGGAPLATGEILVLENRIAVRITDFAGD